MRNIIIKPKCRYNDWIHPADFSEFCVPVIYTNYKYKSNSEDISEDSGMIQNKCSKKEKICVKKCV